MSTVLLSSCGMTHGLAHDRYELISSSIRNEDERIVEILECDPSGAPEGISKEILESPNCYWVHTEKPGGFVGSYYYLTIEDGEVVIHLHLNWTLVSSTQHNNSLKADAVNGAA